MRWYLDTQLYSYLANGTIKRAVWDAALAGRELWLSPITAYELLEGALKSSPHTYPISLAALGEARQCAPGVIEQGWIEPVQVSGWITSQPERLSISFFQFRERVARGRDEFLARIRSFMSACRSVPAGTAGNADPSPADRAAKPTYRRIGDPLFSSEWQAIAGRAPGEHLDAAFVFHTSVLDRAMRIRYNPDKHPSDYLDYLQLSLLNDESLAFLTADRRLARAVTRSMQSDRIYLWEELAGR